MNRSGSERPGHGIHPSVEESHVVPVRLPVAPPMATVTSNLRAFSRERALSGTKVRYPRPIRRTSTPAQPPARCVLPRTRARTEPDSWWRGFAPAVLLRAQSRGARPRRDTTAQSRRGGRQGRAGAAGAARPRRRGRRWFEEDLQRCPGGAERAPWLEVRRAEVGGGLGRARPGGRRRVGADGRVPDGGLGGRAAWRGAGAPGRTGQRGPCSPGPSGDGGAAPRPSLRPLRPQGSFQAAGQREVGF